ncbi:MAG: PilZ domain-containing protein [Planctomycetota bacterium]
MPQPRPNSDPSQGPERRQWQRVQAEWPITVVLDDGPHEARIRDVSRGGVCFFLDRPVPEMTALRIEFDLPVEGGVRRISGLGAVVRCERIAQALEHYEIAVFLQEMADPDRETVEAYVDRWRADHQVV